MKKLSKLSISILSLGAIAASAIPLAACNKYTDGVKVTEKEWNNALAYIAATVEGASWKSSKDDSFELTTYNSQGNPQTLRFNTLAFNDKYAELTGSSTGGGVTRAEKAISVAKGDFYFTYSNVEGEEGWDTTIEEYSAFEKILIVMVLAIGGQDSFTFDSNIKAYIYNGDYEYEGLDVHSDVTIRFDSNKKITYIKFNSTATNKETKVKEMIFGLTLHPQYNNVKVNIPEELITRANEHTLNVPSSKTVNLPTSHNGDGVIVNVTVDGTYTTLTAKDNGPSSGWTPIIKYVCKNGEHLVRGTDYTLTSAEHQMKINFIKEQIKKNDMICFAYDNFQSQATTLTIEFA